MEILQGSVLVKEIGTETDRDIKVKLILKNKLS